MKAGVGLVGDGLGHVQGCRVRFGLCRVGLASFRLGLRLGLLRIGSAESWVSKKAAESRRKPAKASESQRKPAKATCW